MRTFIVGIDSSTNWHDLLFTLQNINFMINQHEKYKNKTLKGLDFVFHQLMMRSGTVNPI